MFRNTRIYYILPIVLMTHARVIPLELLSEAGIINHDLEVGNQSAPNGTANRMLLTSRTP